MHITTTTREGACGQVERKTRLEKKMEKAGRGGAKTNKNGHGLETDLEKENGGGQHNMTDYGLLWAHTHSRT